MTKLIHIAGPMISGLQRCSRCAMLILDRTQHVAAGKAPPNAGGWAEGLFLTETRGPRGSTWTPAPPRTAATCPPMPSAAAALFDLGAGVAAERYDTVVALAIDQDGEGETVTMFRGNNSELVRLAIPHLEQLLVQLRRMTPSNRLN